MAGQLRVFDGRTWQSVEKVNVDTYGVQINVQAHLYGIRYRRFETNAMAWGAEGEVQVRRPARPL